MLVRYQEFNTIIEAIEFEKRIKGKSRSFKIELIEVNNLYWLNLSKTEGI